jgi:hypothetical protein
MKCVYDGTVAVSTVYCMKHGSVQWAQWAFIPCLDYRANNRVLPHLLEKYLIAPTYRFLPFQVSITVVWAHPWSANLKPNIRRRALSAIIRHI